MQKKKTQEQTYDDYFKMQVGFDDSRGTSQILPKTTKQDSTRHILLLTV
jgi:hypothetical protein